MSRLPLRHWLTNLRPIARNVAWWRARPLTSREKVRYYGAIAAAVAGRRRRVRYLGADFCYDNPATPLNLQDYPFEVSRTILGNMTLVPRSVLDIGANLGQFSVTMHRVLGPSAVIDAFEPNPDVFDLLQRNTAHLEGVRVHPFGVGAEAGEAVIHFDPARTGIGSMFVENAGDVTSHAAVRLTADPGTVTGRTAYDLVKVDVEGYEFHTLSGLAGVTTRYLYLEVSGLGRTKDYRHSELFDRLRDLWGPFDICSVGSCARDGQAFDLLVEFHPGG